MPEGTIQFVVNLRGGATAAADARKVTQEVQRMGGSVKTVGRESSIAAGGTGRFASGIKRLAVGLVAVGAGYKAWSAAKGAISYTRDLAEASGRLSKATGMNIETSSRYVGVAGALGVSSASLGIAFTKLAKQSEIQRAGTGHTVTAFDRLGITTDWVRKHHDDFNAITLKTVQRLDEMQGGATKLKVSGEVLGKGWQALSPIFGEGSAHLEHVLSIAKKYGVELHGGVTKELMQLREAQLESTLATDGLRIAFTKTAAGPLLGMVRGFATLKNDIRTGNWRDFDKQMGKTFDVLSRVVEDFEAKSIETFGQLSPKLLKAFWNGFQKASFPNKALVAGLLLTKMGITGAAFGALGKRYGGRLAGGIERGVGPSSLGGKLGTAFGAAFGIAAAVLIANLIREKLQGAFGGGLASLLGAGADANVAEDKLPLVKHVKGVNRYLAGHPDVKRRSDQYRAAHQISFHEYLSGRGAAGEGLSRHARGQAAYEYNKLRREHRLPGGRMPGLATGGVATSAGLIEVGEHGREVMSVPAGAQVAPLRPGSLADNRDIVLKVDGKVLARVNRRELLQSQAAGA